MLWSNTGVLCSLKLRCKGNTRSVVIMHVKPSTLRLPKIDYSKIPCGVDIECINRDFAKEIRIFAEAETEEPLHGRSACFSSHFGMVAGFEAG